MYYRSEISFDTACYRGGSGDTPVSVSPCIAGGATLLGLNSGADAVNAVALLLLGLYRGGKL